MAIIAGAIAAVGGIAGGAISASGASKAQKSAMANQKAAFGRAQSYLDSLASGKMGSLEDIFGSRLNPEAFLYHPVDITQSQLDTISGNLKAFPSIQNLVNKVNPDIWRNDLSRIRTLMPTFDNSRDMYLGTTQKLLAGQLPFQDVEDIVSNRAGMSSMLGTPGGGRAATLRDLGMSRLSAMQQGGSMFQQFIQMAEAISPVGGQLRPQQMMFTPQERLQADILQRSLEQQGEASAEMARAMPDPAAAGLANANIALNMAGIGASYQPSSGAGSMALGQSIANAAGMFGSIYGMSRAPSFANQNYAPSLNGSGFSASATPWTGGYYPSVGGGVTAATGNLLTTSGNQNFQSFAPMALTNTNSNVNPILLNGFDTRIVPSASATNSYYGSPMFGSGYASPYIRSALNSYGFSPYRLSNQFM